MKTGTKKAEKTGKKNELIKPPTAVSGFLIPVCN